MLLALPNLGERYSPLYFLAALGAGGLMVTFFMYLMFWVPHPGQPVPVFEDIAAALAAGPMPLKAAVAIAWAGILFFAYLHVRLLVWNLRQYTRFRATNAYKTLVSGNGETQLMAIPLTLAMTINGGFILGLVFVPGLWTVVEYLFPLALLAFLGVGWFAFRLLGAFFARVLTQGGFDCAVNNSFAQLLPAFALAMIGVGLAAPAAMSDTQLVAGLSYIASTFFIVSAVVLGSVALFLGFRSMLENGASPEAAPTLWVAIPIATVISIALMRQEHGLHVHFDAHAAAAANFTMLTQMLALQLLFALLGAAVLKRIGYFGSYVFGPKTSAGSYALVCPGVALSVLLHFYINKGLVEVGLVEQFSAGYWAMTAFAIGLQVATIVLVFKLNAKHFASGHMEPAMSPAR
ncbi:hypothetical protein GCM10011316_25130 [Roseibium aquae]|uniref:Uncharacterized protein n=1 Tax=Roseibium aquae TaxID=1323746 RepID=A0A916TKT5_9HYPH|nr:hypothetical protein [Roseibium aquae]GGB52099.1 hypothetical protein GCM10011316_25130 [Roseibium aquae]